VKVSYFSTAELTEFFLLYFTENTLRRSGILHFYSVGFSNPACRSIQYFMSKRFTDTEKWKKPFLKSLSLKYKLVWFYILDDCDYCGIWQSDWDVLKLRIGEDFDEQDFLSVLSEKIIDLGDGKYFIPSFISFQYGNQLSKSNKIYTPILQKVNKYNLWEHLQDVVIIEESTNSASIRKRISEKYRNEIFLRDKHTCQYCSNEFKQSELVIDHIIPIHSGGTNNCENLITSCYSCNSKKSNLSLNDFVSRNDVKPTERVLNFLNGAFKELDTGKEQVQVQVKVQEQVQDSSEWKPELKYVIQLMNHEANKIGKRLTARSLSIESEKFIHKYPDVDIEAANKVIREWVKRVPQDPII